MHIGQVIRVLRIQRGLTQEQLALDAQVATSNVSRIENGLRQPSQDLLQRLADSLGTPVSLIYAMGEMDGEAPAHNRPTWSLSTREIGEPAFSRAPDLSGGREQVLSGESQALLKRFYQLAPKYRSLVLEHIQMLKRLQEQESGVAPKDDV